MSIFVTNYNTNQPELLPHLSRNCVCCLAVNVTFVQLEKCLHKQFLIEYFKNEINFKCSVICLKCHNFLLKIEKFKQLITRSIICSVKHTKKEPNNPISLKRTAIQILSIIPIYLDNVNHTLLRNKKGSKQDPLYRVQEIHQEPTDNNTRTSEDTRDVSEDGSKDFCVDFDIKTDVCSDDEVNHKECTDVKVEPSVAERKTSETESENELTDYMKNPYSFSAPPDPNCYNGRIKILSLTPEQVLAERETLRRHPNYVNKNFKCDLCIKGFIHKNALDSHMKRHDEKHGPALCPICKSYQKTDVILKNHYKRHFTRYECVICGLRFMCETSCGGHYNSAHGKKHGVLAFDHRCNKCDYVTDCYRNLTHHKRTHRKISRECNECYRIFTTDTGYANHIRNCHTGEKQVYSCKLCNKMCKSSSSFNYHMTSKHIWESGRASKTYCCAECKTVYSSKQGLVAHLSTHSKHAKKGEAKLICHDCGAKFHNKPEIKRHIHLNHMRINKCPVCSKIYSTSSGLRTHTERAHLGKEAPRDKICQYCGKGFTTNVTLKVHIRTHTLERPLKCPQCPATFAHPAARYNHKKLVHNPNRVRKARQTQKFVDGVDNK